MKALQPRAKLLQTHAPLNNGSFHRHGSVRFCKADAPVCLLKPSLSACKSINTHLLTIKHSVCVDQKNNNSKKNVVV
jgi:hypothetical protein